MLTKGDVRLVSPLTLGLVTISHIQRAAKGPHAIRYPRAVIAII